VPTPREVALRADQVVLPTFEFPRTLWTVSKDERFGATAWLREFRPASAGDYYWASIQVDVTLVSAIARTRVTTHDCAGATWTDGDPLVKQTVTAENVADAAGACAFHWADSRQFQYHAAVRNVYIRCANNPRARSITDAEALQFCIDIVRKQVEVVNRVAPAR